MNDRGMIKWAPFNSVINGTVVIKEIIKEKEKVEKPILSEEQVSNIEEKIINSYENNDSIEIIYYKNQKYNKITGKITKLDPTNKIIMINYKTNIYFNNIIDILVKNT